VAGNQEVLPDADPAVSMGYWTEADIPFYYGLARTFPLADHWFSSCLGPTFPNRRFLIAGTAHGLIDDLPFDLLDYPPAGTIFDMFTKHGISWADYHAVPADKHMARRYAHHTRRMARRRLQRMGRSLRAVTDGVQKDLQFTANVFPLGIARYMLHVRSTDEFFADADAGTLPSFSIVDPDFDVYSEENPQDIRKGESFAAEVINRVMHGRNKIRIVAYTRTVRRIFSTIGIWTANIECHTGFTPDLAAEPGVTVPGGGRTAVVCGRYRRARASGWLPAASGRRPPAARSARCRRTYHQVATMRPITTRAAMM
jgi:hypothetical protein